MSNLSAYQGKLAIVTGAGDGIGEMLARKLAASGLRVCVQDIREEAAKAVAKSIGSAAVPSAFDVSDRKACFDAADQLSAEGPLSPLFLVWQRLVARAANAA